MKFKIKSTGETIIADLAFMEAHHAGDFEEVIEVAAPVAKAWPAFDFYRKFTIAERIAIRTLAKTDPVAEDILHTLDAAISSGSNVRSDDLDTVRGLAYLEAPASGEPPLAPGRAAEILV